MMYRLYHAEAQSKLWLHTLTKVNHRMLLDTLLNHRGFRCFLFLQ